MLSRKENQSDGVDPTGSACYLLTFGEAVLRDHGPGTLEERKTVGERERGRLRKTGTIRRGQAAIRYCFAAEGGRRAFGEAVKR